MIYFSFSFLRSFTMGKRLYRDRRHEAMQSPTQFNHSTQSSARSVIGNWGAGFSSLNPVGAARSIADNGTIGT